MLPLKSISNIHVTLLLRKNYECQIEKLDSCLWKLVNPLLCSQKQSPSKAKIPFVPTKYRSMFVCDGFQKQEILRITIHQKYVSHLWLLSIPRVRQSVWIYLGREKPKIDQLGKCEMKIKLNFPFAPSSLSLSPTIQSSIGFSSSFFFAEKEEFWHFRFESHSSGRQVAKVAPKRYAKWHAMICSIKMISTTHRTPPRVCCVCGVGFPAQVKFFQGNEENGLPSTAQAGLVEKILAACGAQTENATCWNFDTFRSNFLLNFYQFFLLLRGFAVPGLGKRFCSNSELVVHEKKETLLLDFCMR